MPKIYTISLDNFTSNTLHSRRTLTLMRVHSLMVKKIFIFAPNKIDVYTVGVGGVIKIEVYEHLESRAVYIYYETSQKVYCGMPFIYDADHTQNPYAKKSDTTVTE